jgi:type IV pilus assembly protein PilM
MAKPPAGIWGIDLGQCALKALRVELADDQVTATAFDYVEHPKILSQPDADPDQLIREALQKFLSRNSLKGDMVCISIPGQSGLARFVKLPPVEEKKITDIVRFEAKQQIPFNLDEVVWDYQKLSSGVVTDGFAMETEIGLFAIKRDTVNRYLQHFKDVGVEVHTVQMAPLALCNFVSYDLLEKSAAEGEPDAGGKKRCVVALDIGADNSNLVITDGQRIIWQRPIPLGGNHFTRALTKDMKLTFAKAEHLKRNATKSPDLKQILSSLKPVLNDFVGEVQRSLGYFTNTHRDASIQYMVGLGNAFRLPGLQKFLGEKLQLEVRKLQKLERLAGNEVVTAPVYTENVLSFAVAYGLALQGLGVARLYTNLLPQDIRVQRMIRAKKPWAVTAAASLLLAASLLAMGYSMQYRAVAADQVKNALKAGDDVKTKVEGFDRQVNDLIQKKDAHTKEVKTIVAGQEERMNWIQFNQFVNRCLPKPDASNLSDEAKNYCWTKEAQDAYQKFAAAQQGKNAAAAADEEEWRDHLIQANVEMVFCAYSKDLSTFLPKIKGDQTVKDTGYIVGGDGAKPADQAGWIVEVHGYTYYKDRPLEFLKKAVADNFARLPIKVVLASPTGETNAKASTEAPAAQPAPAAATGAGDKPASGDQPAGADANQASNVVLYTFARDWHPEPGHFALIGKPIATSFASGGGGGGGGEGSSKMSTLSSMMGSGGGGGGSGWTPLSPGGAGGGKLGGNKFGGGGLQTGSEGGAGSGGMAGAMAAQAQGTQAMMQKGTSAKFAGIGGGKFSGAAGGAHQPPAASSGRNGHVRTEFILLFVWKEPASEVSKALLEGDDAGAAANPLGGK